MTSLSKLKDSGSGSPESLEQRLGWVRVAFLEELPLLRAGAVSTHSHREASVLVPDFPGLLLYVI